MLPDLALCRRVPDKRVTADFLQAFLQSEARELVERQARKQLDASSEDDQRLTKRFAPLGVGTGDGGGIRPRASPREATLSESTLRRAAAGR